MYKMKIRKMLAKEYFVLNLSLLIMLPFSIFGCGNTNTTSSEPISTQNTGYEVVDDHGTLLKFTEKPKQIYATTISLEEILVELVPPERIAAISEPALEQDNSLIVNKAMKVAVRVPQHVSVEQLLKLHPDLVIAQETNAKEYVQSLKDVGFKVFVSKVPVTAEQVKKRIRNIAIAVGEKEKGDQMLAAFDTKLKRIHAVTDKIPAKKVIMAYSPLGVFGSSKGIFHAICTEAGVINGAAEAGLTRGEHLSKEKIIAVNPDVLLFPSDTPSQGGDMQGVMEEVRHDPALKQIKAVQNNCYVYTKDRYRYAASQYFADAALLIAKGVYPEYFK